MKVVNIAVLLSILIAVSSFSLKKNSKNGVYAFGLSASFTDTVVYYTEIQLLDSVKLKKGFLPNRDLYSYQFKNYLEYQKGQKNRTCMIYFDDDEEKLKKEQEKLLERYKKTIGTVVMEIPSSEFTFKKPEE